MQIDSARKEEPHSDVLALTLACIDSCFWCIWYGGSAAVLLLLPVAPMAYGLVR